MAKTFNIKVDFLFENRNLSKLRFSREFLEKFRKTRFNSWPTFSPYLYNKVWSELTCRNSLSHSRLACSRLSAHIQPSVNNPDTNGRYNGHELS